jgi:hypothetical protein
MAWVKSGDQIKQQDEFFWICFFCLNQFRPDIKPEIFKLRVKTIGYIIAVLDKWKGPEYLKRKWCIYEVFEEQKLKRDAQCQNVENRARAIEAFGAAKELEVSLTVLREQQKKRNEDANKVANACPNLSSKNQMIKKAERAVANASQQLHEAAAAPYTKYIQSFSKSFKQSLSLYTPGFRERELDQETDEITLAVYAVFGKSHGSQAEKGRKVQPEEQTANEGLQKAKDMLARLKKAKKDKIDQVSLLIVLDGWLSSMGS